MSKRLAPTPAPNAPVEDVLAVAGARVRQDPDTDALLLQFEVSERRAETDATSFTPWLSIPQGLLPDILALLERHANIEDTRRPPAEALTP